MTAAPERFNELFERTHAAVLAYAVRRCSDPADAADVVAETFLVAWRRLDRVPDGAGARPWLFGVARRVLANHRRGQRRQHAMADRLRQELTLAPALGEEAPPAALTDAIDRLSETDRELLRLLAWDGLSHQEAAVALGITPGALRVRLHRTRRRLEAMLREPDGGGPSDANHRDDPSTSGLTQRLSNSIGEASPEGGRNA